MDDPTRGMSCGSTRESHSGPKVGPGTPPLIDNYFRRHTAKTNLGPFFPPDGESVGHPKARGGG